jgi:hypothetical protein
MMIGMMPADRAASSTCHRAMIRASTLPLRVRCSKLLATALRVTPNRRLGITGESRPSGRMLKRFESAQPQKVMSGSNKSRSDFFANACRRVDG